MLQLLAIVILSSFPLLWAIIIIESPSPLPWRPSLYQPDGFRDECRSADKSSGCWLAKDSDSAGVTVDDYSGKEKLEAARSVAVDLDVEARLNRYINGQVCTPQQRQSTCACKGQGRNPDKDGYSLVLFNCFSGKKFDALRTELNRHSYDWVLGLLYYRADWEPAASSRKCMAGVPGVFWRSPAVLWGPSTHNPALVAGKPLILKNWPIFPMCMWKWGGSAPCGQAHVSRPN